MPVLTAILVLGSIGFVFGAILAYAGKAFAVVVDPRIEQTLDLLPGANCGGCGFPGCAGLATAIVEKGVSATSCPVVSAENRQKIEALLGPEFSAQAAGKLTVRKVALVHCQGIPDEQYQKFEYHGIPDCQAAVLLLSGPWNCPHRCIGLGSCMRACPFGAITIGPNRLPVIDDTKCVGCGKCVLACPKQLIELVDQKKTVHVKCNSMAKGAEVRKVCRVGCIGCKLCEKVCAYDAIKVENNLARIDHEKCVECGACVAKCPQHSIFKKDEPNFLPRKAVIDETRCVGCTICFQVCKFQAIDGGTPKEIHRIIADKCVGCKMCVDKCPQSCIEMVKIQSSTNVG